VKTFAVKRRQGLERRAQNVQEYRYHEPSIRHHASILPAGRTHGNIPPLQQRVPQIDKPRKQIRDFYPLFIPLSTHPIASLPLSTPYQAVHKRRPQVQRRTSEVPLPRGSDCRCGARSRLPCRIAPPLGACAMQYRGGRGGCLFEAAPRSVAAQRGRAMRGGTSPLPLYPPVRRK
jgi:hypothetical protein